MTILFLDFDGVLNDDASLPTADRKPVWDTMPNATPIERHAATDILPEYTARVRQIVADTGARVVVCSAWQDVEGKRQPAIRTALAGHGIDVYGFTLDHYRPRFSEHGWRWPAIKATVKDLSPDRWCWLDDEADPSMPESVRVVDGVTDADVARAVAILRGEA